MKRLFIFVIPYIYFCIVVLLQLFFIFSRFLGLETFFCLNWLDAQFLKTVWYLIQLQTQTGSDFVNIFIRNGSLVLYLQKETQALLQLKSTHTIFNSSCGYHLSWTGANFSSVSLANSRRPRSLDCSGTATIVHNVTGTDEFCLSLTSDDGYIDLYTYMQFKYVCCL